MIMNELDKNIEGKDDTIAKIDTGYEPFGTFGPTIDALLLTKYMNSMSREEISYDRNPQEMFSVDGHTLKLI